MEARDITFGLLMVIFLTMAFNGVFIDIAVNNNLTHQTGLNMSTFNRTRDILDITRGMKNETGFIEDVPIIGDVVALVGSGARALKLMWELPSIFGSILAETAGFVGIPNWIYEILNAFVWVALVFIMISAYLRYRT